MASQKRRLPLLASLSFFCSSSELFPLLIFELFSYALTWATNTRLSFLWINQTLVLLETTRRFSRALQHNFAIPLDLKTPNTQQTLG